MADLYVTITSDQSVRTGVPFELRYEIRNVCAEPVHWITGRPRFRAKPESVAIVLGLLPRSDLERHYAWQPPPLEILPPGEAATGIITVTLPLRFPTLDLATWSSGAVEAPGPGPVAMTLSVGHARSPMPLYPEPDLERALAWQAMARSARLHLDLLP